MHLRRDCSLTTLLNAIQAAVKLAALLATQIASALQMHTAAYTTLHSSTYSSNMSVLTASALLLKQKAAAKESMLKRQAEAARRKKADECDRWWRGAELLFGPRTEANGAPPGSDATVKPNDKFIQFNHS
jgi:hypothetical protein